MRNSAPANEIHTLPIGCDVRKLFVALMAIKSKPAELPTREYLNQVQKRTREKTTTAIESSHNPDSAICWHSQYAALKAAQPALHNRIAQLEQQNQDLQRKLKLATSVPPSAGTRSKRKRVDLEAEAVDYLAVAQKQCQSGDDNIFRTLRPQRNGIETHVDIKELEVYFSSDEVNRYCRQIYRLRQLLGQESTDPDLLGIALVQLSSAVIEVLSKSPSQPPKIGQNITRENLTRIEVQAELETLRICRSHQETSLQLIARTFHYIIEGLDRLDRGGDTRAWEGRVTHGIVMIVSNILEQIGRVSSIKSAKCLGRNRKTKEVGSLVQEPPVAECHAEEEDAMSVCRLLVAITVCLDTTRPSQLDVLEGIVYLILNRTGNVLKTFVFDTASNTNPRLPHLESRASRVSQQPNKNVAEAQAEARYLIWILERVLLIYRLSESERVVNSDGTEINIESSPSELLPSALRTLTEQAKKKLQNTLLTCVFGDGDFSFEDRFRLPIDPRLKTDAGFSNVEETDVAKWFQQEVWRLLAWDVVENTSAKSRCHAV